MQLFRKELEIKQTKKNRPSYPTERLNTDGKTIEVECSREVAKDLRQQLREQLLFE